MLDRVDIDVGTVGVKVAKEGVWINIISSKSIQQATFRVSGNPAFMCNKKLICYI